MFWGVRLESCAPLFHDWPIHREPVYGSCTPPPYTISLWRVRQTHRSKMGEVETPLLQPDWGASPWKLHNPLPWLASGGLVRPTGTVSSTAGSPGLTMDSGERPGNLHISGLCRARKGTEEPCGQLRSPLGNGFPRAFKPVDVVPPLPQLSAP